MASSATGAGTLLAGRYLLGPLIGEGGMATVHRAHDERLGRDVAVKLFRPDVADARDLRRIRSEIRMLAGLNHPSLVTLHDAATGEAGEPAYLILELVDGPNLAELLRDRPVTAAEFTRLLSQVADALGYIGSRGVVHRDVKPENVLVTTDEDDRLRAKLADLGIARIADESRLTTAGMVIGTARYLSPEQVSGGLVGPPSDVYSLGIVLLEGLTGRAPFPGTGTEQAIARTVRPPVLPAGLTPPDAELLASMTAVDPADRPSARQARDGLLAWSSHGPFASTAEPPTLLLPPADRGTSVLPELDEDPEREQATALASGDRTEILRVPSEDRTAVLPVVPGDRTAVPTGPTSLLPRPDPPPPAPHAPQHARRRRAAWSVLLVLLLAGGSVGVVAAWPAITAWIQPGPPEPPPAYPAVEGELGTGLAQLQTAIEGEGLTDELTRRLREDALAVATAAAVTDYPGAVTSLEELASHVDQAALADQVTSARYREILASIEGVREELEAAVAAEQAELERLREEHERIQQEQEAAEDRNIFDGLRDRLDQLGRDLQRQIERWTGEAAQG
ncbi:serine/threonine-protein kinase [Naasia sp. SYSU D00948]|uniref:serine/threonine-protein kinase n=1 Tax=Naasia sp. SYSU D00948 TaxID=2817379 RepID=UPI001B3122B9|nr:serine/threonine-protein kinase [Naasia sp. SYSU D00948]